MFYVLNTESDVCFVKYFKPVLSTNWDEVGQKKVEMKPPDDI